MRNTRRGSQIPAWVMHDLGQRIELLGEPLASYNEREVDAKLANLKAAMEG